MRLMLRRASVYWPMMMDDCVWYKKGCEACQRFGDVQLSPASVMHPMIKPWSFRRWGLDFIGEVYPASSKGHQFVLIATDILLYQVDQSSSFKGYDTQGDDLVHA
jgi:hypothetical protein